MATRQEQRTAPALAVRSVLIAMMLIAAACGGQEVQSLKRQLDDSDPEVRLAAARRLTEIDLPEAMRALVVALEHEDVEVASVAGWHLINAGERAAPVIAELFALLPGRDGLRHAAAVALAGVLGDRPPTENELEEARLGLAASTASERWEAAFKLGHFGARAGAERRDEAMAALRPRLEDEDARVRVVATWALNECAVGADDPIVPEPGSVPAEVESDLLRMCADPDPAVRMTALSCISHLLGDNAHEALLDALEDPVPAVRGNAVLWLSFRWVDSPPEDEERAVRLMATQLANPDDSARAFATLALSRLGPANRPVLPQLIATLKDSHPLARSLAAFCISELGHDAIEAEAPLLLLLTDAEVVARSAAIAALAAIGSGDLRPHLFALLDEDEDPEVVRDCLTALGTLGHNDDEVIAALLERVATSDRDFEGHPGAAALSLSQILDPEQLRGLEPETITRLHELTDSWDNRVGAACLLAHRAIARQDRDLAVRMIPTLVESLTAVDRWSAIQPVSETLADLTALEGLEGELEPAAQPLEALLAELSDLRPWERAAVEARLRQLREYIRNP